MSGIFIRSEHSERAAAFFDICLCKFYPQREVSTHHPKINTLQLLFVSYCKGDTFIPAEYTFADC